MNRIPVAAAMILTASLALTTGCATKKSVARETAPLINKTNELDDLTAKTTRDIKDLDARSTKGIADVNTKTDAADQKATAARQQADAANELATKAATGVESLTNQVVNLDNYRPVAETAVHFGFNKADLTKKAKDALDKLAAEVANTKGYIVALEGPKGEGHLAVTSHQSGFAGWKLDSAILTGPDGRRYDLIKHQLLPSEPRSQPGTSI